MDASSNTVNRIALFQGLVSKIVEYLFQFLAPNNAELAYICRKSAISWRLGLDDVIYIFSRGNKAWVVQNNQ